jgi:hypothetical protein
MTHELNTLATNLYPSWVRDRRAFISSLLDEADWNYFQEVGIGEQLIEVNGQILPDYDRCLDDWDCGNWGHLLYALYQIAYDFADYVAARVRI